jgi:hypothetical protein
MVTYLSKTQNPLSKLTTAKSAGGMTQAVQSLPRKCETMSSTPITAKRKKKKLH